jgi:hypothetical protein
MLEPHVSGAQVGLHSKGRLLAMPSNLDKGGSLKTIGNTLAYFDLPICPIFWNKQGLNKIKML